MVQFDLSVVALLVATAFIAYLLTLLYGSNRRLARTRAYLQESQTLVSRRESELQVLREETIELKTRSSLEDKHYRQQLLLLQKAKGDIAVEFENLANRIFDDKQQRFSVQSQAVISASINPLKSQLLEFRQRVDTLYNQESAERNKLVGQINELQKQTLKIGQDAIELAGALKGDNKIQGNWGEMVLERLLEQSGLHKGREYDLQVALSDTEGRRRSPDVIIRLPEGKDIVIDSKVSLLSYEQYCSSTDKLVREKMLKQHVASLRAHINGLSRKAYEQLEGVRSLDFVFIFIPVEAAFMLALQQDPNLLRDASEKQIVLVSATTLLATLKTVASIWRHEKQNINAEKIALQAGGLYDQFVLLLESLGEVGRHIDNARSAHDVACKRLGSGRGNLLRRVDEIKALGAKAKKTIDPKQLNAADLIDG